jgi:hypothetical protein
MGVDINVDLVRVGLARKFKLKLVADPLAECKRRKVEPEAMIRFAESTDVYGRPRDCQRRLF